MHLEVFIRGDIYAIERFIRELSSKYLSFEYMEDDGKGGFKPNTKVNYTIQITVRTAPLGIYEIIFPEQHKDLVLNTVLGKERGAPWQKSHKKYILALRKVMGLEPIPQYKTDKFLPLFNKNMEIIAIGIKKDATDEWGTENI